MGVTQHDIARLANVSQATVSRVLGGDKRVAKTIRKRVLSVMEEHNYRPDTSARTLRSRKTHLIGLVVKRPAQGLNGDPFYSALIAELMDNLADTTYQLCVRMVRSSQDQVAAYDEMLRSKRVDGVLLVESEAWDERIPRLQSDSFPFVVIGNPPKGLEVHSVDNDNVYAGKIATEHLLMQGYRRIGMLAGPEAITVSEDRIQGYKDAMKSVGYSAEIWHCSFGSESTYATTKELFDRHSLPEALVVLDDFMSMGVLQMARECGLKLPQQFGMVSFNDSPLCRLTDCGVSSVNLSIPELVKTATDKLIQIIERGDGANPTRTIVPCRLVVRCSSCLAEEGCE